MAQEFTGGFCTVCKEQRKFERRSQNHILHLLLTLCTCGLWLLVWMAVRKGKWMCGQCGSQLNTAVWKLAPEKINILKGIFSRAGT